MPPISLGSRSIFHYPIIIPVPVTTARRPTISYYSSPFKWGITLYYVEGVVPVMPDGPRPEYVPDIRCEISGISRTHIHHLAAKDPVDTSVGIALHSSKMVHQRAEN